jgi:hypothetical protein
MRELETHWKSDSAKLSGLRRFSVCTHTQAALSSCSNRSASHIRARVLASVVPLTGEFAQHGFHRRWQAHFELRGVVLKNRFSKHLV